MVTKLHRSGPSVAFVSCSVSLGVSVKIFREDLNVACLNVNKAVAQQDFLQNFGSVQAQVLLLQETPNFKYDDHSSAGLGWTLLRNQRGSNWRAPKSGHCSKTAADENCESHQHG